MGTRPARYPEACWAEAVELVRAGERSLPQIARELGVNDQPLRTWVSQALINTGRGQPGELTIDERAELRRLRRENQMLRQEREILKKPRPSSPRRRCEPLSVHPGGAGQLS